jgi:hypothetical protein
LYKYTKDNPLMFSDPQGTQSGPSYQDLVEYRPEGRSLGLGGKQQAHFAPLKQEQRLYPQYSRKLSGELNEITLLFSRAQHRTLDVKIQNYLRTISSVDNPSQLLRIIKNIRQEWLNAGVPREIVDRLMKSALQTIRTAKAQGRITVASRGPTTQSSPVTVSQSPSTPKAPQATPQEAPPIIEVSPSNVPAKPSLPAESSVKAIVTEPSTPSLKPTTQTPRSTAIGSQLPSESGVGTSAARQISKTISVRGGGISGAAAEILFEYLFHETLVMATEVLMQEVAPRLFNAIGETWLERVVADWAYKAGGNTNWLSDEAIIRSVGLPMPYMWWGF